MTRWWPLLALGIAIPAQAGPDLYEPADTVYEGGTAGTATNQAWWKAFADPELDAVMESALGGNRDLSASWRRVDQANAVAMQSFSPILPSVTFDLSANTQPNESVGFSFGAGGFGQQSQADLFTQGSAMFNAGWQIDLFGRQYQSYRASRFDAHASAGDRDAQAIALATRLGEGYFDVAAARERVQVVQDQLAAQESLLELMQLRYEQGSATALDVLQQRQTAAGTAALLPSARAQHRTSEQQLAVLTGRLPTAPVGVRTALPEVPPTPPTGVPADLIEHRPDVRAAEERVTAASARKTSAVLGLLPTLRLSGGAGWQATWSGEPSDQATWNAGAALSVPIFNGGLLHARIRQADATQDIAVWTYDQTLINAISEVEGALVVDIERRAALDAVRTQEDAARQAYDQSTERYLAGLDSYLQVLAAQNAHQQAQLSLITAQRDALSARIQLHDALGGAWADELDAPEPGVP